MEKTLKLRFYPGEDDDLLAWLTTLDALPYGAKGRAIKATLRQVLEKASQKENTLAPTGPTLDLTTLLPEIRQVVEAGVASALSTLPTLGTVAPSPRAEPVEALLATLDAGLLLADDLES